jgi:hypothetical protein
MSDLLVNMKVTSMHQLRYIYMYEKIFGYVILKGSRFKYYGNFLSIDRYNKSNFQLM